MKFLSGNLLTQKTVSCHHLPRLRIAHAASCFRVFTGGKETLRYPQSLTAAKNVVTKPDPTNQSGVGRSANNFSLDVDLTTENSLTTMGKELVGWCGNDDGKS